MACMPRHHGFDSLTTVGLQKLCGMKVLGSIAAGACLIVVTSCGVCVTTDNDKEHLPRHTNQTTLIEDVTNM